QAEVEAAAEAHGRAADQRPVVDMVDIYLADAAGAEAGLARGVWGAIDLVDRLPGRLMRIFSDTHGGVRTIRCFEEQAPPEAHRILATILVTLATELAVRTALSCSLDALEHHLHWFAGPG